MQGGVYKTILDEKPIRIIAFDCNEVFYDVWWDHLNDWGNKNSLKSKVSYYRTSLKRILENLIFIRIEPLSDIEIKVHRPDLPFNTCRILDIKWTDKLFLTFNEYESYLLSKSIDANTISDLNISELILVPFGLKGARKKSVCIKALNETYFTGLELLWHAHNIQAPYINVNIVAGVGLHRLGFEKGIPSYYIGGYNDNMGF